MPEAEDTAFGLKLLTVSQLNDHVQHCLEDRFGLVAVAGEIADLARPRSGHVYFTLRDPRAQIKAVLWRGFAQRLPCTLQDGGKVILVGRITLYTARGSYQIVAQEVIPRGIGEIRRALDALRRKLTSEGLFDEARKRPVPFLPLTVAVITSGSGAAVQDIIRTALSRFPRLVLRIIPVAVQGREAPGEIVRALELANRPGVADVILLGRGGGGVEDLWAFNAEEVVRAVAASQIPVVSCVGHETDVTLSDLAADVRASTPTRAAEVAVPVLTDIQARLDAGRDRAVRAVRSLVGRLESSLQIVAARPGLRQPARRLQEAGQYLDELLARLEDTICTVGQSAYNRLSFLATRLESLSPLEALRRGYTVTRFPSGRLVRSVMAVKPGDRLEIRFCDGFCGVDVIETREERFEQEGR